MSNYAIIISMIDKNTLAYCAGYTDGDGCFHLRKIVSKTGNIKYQAVFIISSTDREILEFFQDQFGGKVKLASDKITSHKPQYHFALYGKNCLQLVEKIRPFLVEKQKEAEIFISFLNSICKTEKDRFCDEIKHIKCRENLIVLSHKDTLHELNRTINPTNEDFSYLAGFIDAECCLSVHRYRSKNRPNFIYKTFLMCNNTKFPIFKWLTERFGGSSRFIDRNTTDSKQRNQLCWTLSSKALENILYDILTHLKYKQAVCQELIEFNEMALPRGGDRQSEEFKASYAHVLQMKESIFNKVHILNRKGV